MALRGNIGIMTLPQPRGNQSTYDSCMGAGLLNPGRFLEGGLPGSP